ncbi:glutaredoxin 2 [Kushneria phyllosphaerae]|uniref:Glutaredoxin 2 n=1 Tax=Kushneria phyllosphaerae TaxID=2100822 RepID=A0A2R8CHK5_9GAMM|nr:glutaredoxin 2 [Kushneria phyllosphaerae]SPJ32366.1 Glutaredoxin 2 [Kushneria phyllosphaerae]
MDLYIYDHCPFCVKARMIFGLREVPVTLKTLLNDDAETPTRLVGEKKVPILEFEDGYPLDESLAIVKCIDSEAEGVKVMDGPRNPEIERWVKASSDTVGKLFIPRVPRAPLGEFATIDAAEHFMRNKEAMFGPFDTLLAQTPELLVEMTRWLNELDAMIQSPEAVNGVLSMDDIELFPVLRQLSLVAGVQYPERVEAYRQAMARLADVPLHDEIAVAA